MSCRRFLSPAAALAILAGGPGGCFELEDDPPTTAYVTDDPMYPEARKDLWLAQQPGIYYEYPVWLDFKHGNESWEAGYVWASLSYLPLVPPFERYQNAAPDTARFSDLVEGVEPIPILFERIIGKDSEGKVRWSDWLGPVPDGAAHSWQGGLHKARIPLDHTELARRHARSPAHTPLRVKLGDRNLWAIGDRMWFLNNVLDTVELYLTDPAAADPPPAPAAVWITARGIPSEGTVKWFARAPSLPYLLGDQMYVLTKIERRPDGGLVAFEARPWEGMPVEALLDGADSEYCIPPRLSVSGQVTPAAQQLGRLRVKVETALNEKLVEWKATDLPKLLSGAKGEDLTKLSVRLEKALLKLDLKVKQLKDAVDEDARQADPKAPRKAPPNALDRAHLLDQRKTILTVILGTVKRAASGAAAPP